MSQQLRQDQLNARDHLHFDVALILYTSLIIVSSGHRLSNRPKLTVMLKSLLCSTICLDTANETVLKLKTEPAPFACEAHGKLYQVSSQTSRGKFIIRRNKIMLKQHHKFLINAL
jgi:hypothetical protein